MDVTVTVIVIVAEAELKGYESLVMAGDNVRKRNVLK